MAFTDEFAAAPLNAGWVEVDPAGAATISVAGGALHWVSGTGYTDMASWKDDAARLVQPAVGNFDISVDFGRDPGNKLDGVGLYVDDGTTGNYRAPYIYFDQQYTVGVSAVTTKDNGSGTGTTLQTPVPTTGMGRYQRLQLVNTTLTWHLSVDGLTWNQWWSGTWSGGGANQRVGFFVVQDHAVTWDVQSFRFAGAAAATTPSAGADSMVRVSGGWQPAVTRTRVGGGWLPAPVGGTITQGTNQITALAETTDYLENPGIGYQGWTHDIGSILPTSVEYRRGNHPEQGKFNWAQCNPSSGTYDWSSIDAMLAAAATRGERASFRIMTMMGESFGGHMVPAWVVSAGATILANGEPDYRLRAYREKFAIFVDALRARYDGDARIAFIDISGYGQFNEWQANPNTDQNDQTLTANSADSNARRHLIHMFTGGSATNQAVLEANGSTGTISYSHAGFQQTQLIMPYGGMWATSRYVLDNYPNVGFRNDALLGPDAAYSVLSQIGHGVIDRWKTAPVAFEPINTGGSTTAFPQGTATMKGFGASLFHDNGTWTADQLRPFLLRLGYRYWCQQVSSPTSAAPGSALSITSTWQNTGYARAYPRMGNDFTVATALARTDGTIAVSGTSGDSVSSWLPGETNLATVTLTAPTAGTYTRLIGVHNRSTNKRILLPLTTGRTDNWYAAGNITIS